MLELEVVTLTRICAPQQYNLQALQVWVLKISEFHCTECSVGRYERHVSLLLAQGSPVNISFNQHLSVASPGCSEHNPAKGDQ